MSTVRKKIHMAKDKDEEEEIRDPKKTCHHCHRKYASLANHVKCQKRGDAMISAKTKVTSVKQEQDDDKEEESRDSKKFQNSDGCSNTGETCRYIDDESKRLTEMTYNGQKPVLSSTDKEELEQFANDIFEKKIISTKNTRNIGEFFGKQVQLRKHQIATAREMFNSLVQKVVCHLEAKTSWRWGDLKSGSYYDGTKVSCPDEMDCMFVAKLQSLEVSTRGAPVGFCYVKVTQPQEDLTNFCQEDFLSSTKFRQYIFSCLEDMLVRPITRDTTQEPGSPSFGINYDTGLKDGDSNFVISIDLVPALYFPGWPDTAGDFSGCTQRQLKDISKKGFLVVAKECDIADAKDRDLLWRLSFSASEKTITKHADLDENDECAGSTERTCRKKVLRILKRILEIAKDDEDSARMDESLATQGKEIASELRRAAQYTREHGYCVAKHKFTTFQLRTLMWNEFYVATLGDHMWGNDSLVNRLKLSIVKLKKMLTGELPMDHFFIPNFDIMAEVPPVERKYLYIMACVAERLL
ncbi:cyclic GMP-AMP synthase-like [Haliotis rubra]|uniref:cyclic GMP-AMP synthase-like n=1 Tax=Haliotis rubra TaxID=36100 RepID=UPI001EE502B6|nr:cyclic GMP-AMP synthase-like [Haliotis rubra]